MTCPAVLETDPTVWRAEALDYIEARVRAAAGRVHRHRKPVQRLRIVGDPVAPRGDADDQ